MSPFKGKWFSPFLSLVFISALSACGSSGGGGGSTTSTLSGTVALNSGESGTVTLNVSTALASNSPFSLVRSAEAQSGNTTGSCVTPSCNLPLTGNFNTSNNTFTVSGSGGTGAGCSSATTTFTGTYTPTNSGTSGSGSMSGTITSTSGGTTTPIGAFSGFNVTNTPGAQNYCGTFNGTGGDPTATDIGVFNVSIDGNNLSGSAQGVCKSENPVGLVATRVGSTNEFRGCSTDSNGAKPICAVVSADGQSVIGFFDKEPHCQGGTNDGNQCSTGTDCPGGSCNTIIGCFSGTTAFCSTNTAPSCTSPTPCGAQNCTLPTSCP